MAEKNNFQSPFMIGFVAGLAAGAAAVYFFATERGEDFLDEMGDLWKEARPELVKQGVIEDADKTLGQAAKSFLIGTFAQEASDLKADLKGEPVVPRKRVKNKMLFKGV
ncbi:MAG: hypothetical protein ABII10_03260 [Candidatus Paceibacterota bacterium]